MKTKFAASILVSVFVSLASPLQTVLAQPAECASAAPVEQGEVVVTVRAKLPDACINFQPDNDPDGPKSLIPWLVLYRNGELTNLDERTLNVKVSGVAIGAEVEIRVETQHNDPDLIKANSSDRRRIQVWHDSKQATSIDVTFEYAFGETTMFGAATPTDYFRYLILVDGVPQGDGKGVDYAFLMENQVIIDLSEYTPDMPPDIAIPPDELKVYYYDMVPFGIGWTSMDRHTWLDREEDVQHYVLDVLAPAIKETFRTQTIDWEFPWSAKWENIWRDEDRDDTNDKFLSITLSDGETWYHTSVVGPGVGLSPITYSAGGGFAGYADDTLLYFGLLQGHIEKTYHELFHQVQLSLKLEQETPGSMSVWKFFTEGTAVLASSVGQRDVEFTTSNYMRSGGVMVRSTRVYIDRANSFLKSSPPGGDLNTSYRDINEYHAAIYWRFLYEQCGGMPGGGAENPAAGMDVIRRSLQELYRIDVATDAIVEKMPEVMDLALAGGCPAFATHEASLTAFARAIYALRLENGRCRAESRDYPAGCTFYDPSDLYSTPDLITTAPDIFSSTSGDITHTLEQIAGSFGMDFAEFDLDSSLNGELATLVFSDAAGDDEFNVQAWKLLVPVGGGKPVAVGEAETLSQTDADGNLVYTFAIDTAAEENAFNRLGVIITRIDADESTDPLGLYSIRLTIDADGDGISDTVECPVPNINACLDTDNDGIPDYLDLDSDDDTISDRIEAECAKDADGKIIVGDGNIPCNTDTVAEGTPDYIDDDSDNDGASDKDEAGDPNDPDNFPLDSNEDGLPDFRDRDSKPPAPQKCFISIPWLGINWFCDSLPGNDHPDDNHSASAFSPLPVQPLPAGARPEPRVAILKSGFHWATESLVRSAGERTYWLDTDFDPAATVAKYPVLIIPSGGLYGMESSTSFRARLEEYAQLGGVVVAFDQQHGYEYATLPGSQVGGFGWAEDNSCFSASLQIAQWHPLLSGFDHATLTAHVDGYFTSMPQDAQVLLARSVNGKPGLILYPFGEGWVLATTSFDDWGAGNGQASPDSRTLLRNLLAWAVDQPGTQDGLQEYSPGEAVSVSIPIINTGDTPITSVQMNLVSPERQIIATQPVTTEIGAGQTVDVPFTTTAAMPLGIWRVDATKMNDVAVAGNPPSAIFAVANPVDPVTPNSSLLLSITAPADRFTPHSVAPFTFHVVNNSDTERTATIHYGLPHHTWESGDSSYGNFSNNSHTLTIPPHEEATYTWSVSVFTTDRLWASLSETVNGQVRTVSKAHFAVYRAYASAAVSATSEPGRWMRNTPVTVTLTVTNTSQALLNGSLVLRALDARNVAMGEPATLPLEVSAGGQDDVTHTFTVPSTVASGTAILSAVIQDSAGNVIGGGYAPFEVPFSPLSLELASLPTLQGGTTASIGVNVTNQRSDQAVEHGDLTLTLTTPDSGSTSPTSPVPFSVQPTTTETVTAPLALPALHFGEYMLRADTQDEYSTRYTKVTWDTRPWLRGILDNYTYQAGETASLEVRLTNRGPVVLPLTATAGTEFYTTSSTTLPDLQPYATLTHTFSIPIPAEVEADSYPVTLILALPSGDTLTQVVAWLQVPPSELACTFDEPDIAPQPGEALTATVTNVGGARTSGTYELELQDAAGFMMQSGDGALSDLNPDGPQPISIDIPQGLVSGQYTFICRTEDDQTDEARTVSWPVQVAGVEASLDVSTDQEVYPADETITVTADVTNTGAALPEGQLDVRITQGDDSTWSWDIFNNQDQSNPFSNWVASVTIDAEGNVWVGDYDYDKTRHINMLSPGSTSWTTYELPIGTTIGEVSDIAVDADGRKWMGTDQGVARLSAANESWVTFTTADGLESNVITSIAIDAAGNIWCGTDAGASKLTQGSSRWDTYTYENTGHGLASDMVHTVEVDSNGNIWFGTDAGLSKLADGTWATYTSGLLSHHVSDIAFDEAGNVWMATPAIGSEEAGGVSVLMVDGVDETWETYTPPTGSGTKGLASKYVTSLAVDAAGRIWIGHDGYGVDILLPDGLTWMHFDGGAAGVLSGYIINDIAASPNGDVWLATQPLYWGANDGGVTHAYNAGPGRQLVWRAVSTISLEESTGTFDNDWLLNAEDDLGATGKFRLEATLTSLAADQRVAYDEQSFYVFPPEVALTLETDTGLCRPGQTIQVSGVVENTGNAPFSGRTLTLTQDGETIQTIGTFNLDPGGQMPFSVTTNAPASTGMTVFTASIDVEDLQVTEAVEVGLPMVTADLEAPALAGSQSFPLVVNLTNSGPLDAAVEAVIVTSDPEILSREVTFTVLAGQVYRLEEEYTITRDTVFTFTFSGDFSKTLEHTVAFGEALEAEFSPDAVYPEGQIAIPYTLTNTGQLPLQFTTTITVEPTDPDWQDEISTYLAPQGVADGNLILDLAPGDYTLDYSTPFGAGTATFSIVPAETATLGVTAGPVEDSTITLTAQLANNGFNPIDGVLRVETPFMSADHPVSLAAGGAETIELPIDLSLAEAGSYTATVTLLSSAGSTLASGDVSIDVPGAELVLTGIPTDTPVTAGEPVTLTFEVANNGSAPAMAEIAISLGDLLDETNSVWLPGDESGQIDFTFQAPDGLTGETLTGEFWFEGERDDLVLDIVGLSLEVSAGWDQAVYNAGDTATLSVTVTNQAAVDAPPLYAHVSYNGEFFTQPLELAASGTQVLDFALTVDAAADPKVFYAIYETAEERGVYLNTTYLYVRNPDVTIVTDRSVYQPGETVHAIVYTTLTSTLAVKGPGLDTTLNLAGSDLTFDFELPDDLLRGTYTIDYALGEAVYSTPFDVDAVWVRVTEANLLDTPYAPSDTVRAELTVASTAALDVGLRAWLLYPDGTQSQESTSTVSLSGIANNHVQIELDLVTAQAGPHRLIYLLVDPNDPDRVYAAGSETFDVGAAQVLGVHTDRDSYPLDSDPVTASVTLYAEEAMSVHLELLLDGVVVAGHDIPLVAGVQTETIPVPAPISPADHVLVARLQVGALVHSAGAGFAYGTDVVDLVAGSPHIITTDASTRMVRAYIYNTGRTASTESTVQVWDGDPADGGILIGEQALPALEPNTSVQIETVWDVLGQAGMHTLVILADTGGQVDEYHEENNSAMREVTIPDFDLAIESSASSYDEGQPVLVTLQAANLTQSAAGLVVTTTAADLSNEVVFTDAQTLTIPAASQVSREITWDTAQAVNQVYTIRARSDAGIDSNVLTVTVENVAPLVDAGPDQIIDENEAAAFAGSFIDPGLLDTHTVEWDFGDGAVATGTLSPVHTYVGSDVYTVTLTVTDNDGGVGSDTLTVTVSNVAPVVDAGPDAATAEGDAFTGAGSFTDPGPDTWTATVDYGDGTGVQPLALAGQSFDLAHTYVDNGAYTVEVCVADDDGGSGCDSLTVTVSNVAPVVDAGPDRTADEGSSVLMAGSFTDPGLLDTHTIEWDFGDGTTAGDTLIPIHVYSDDGAYTVTLTVTDNDGGVGSDTRTVTVSNVAPDVTFSGPGTAEAGTPVTFEGAFTDPGSADTHTISWSFGDGGTLAGALTATHSFSAPGTYTVTLTVTDDDGGVGEWEATIQVNAAITGLVVTSTGDGADSNTGDGICNDGTGACTLRAAIQQANATAGLDTIAFNIPGAGPHTIQPTSALPAITDPVVIDGATQPGYAGSPLVELDGTNAGSGTKGFSISSGGSTLRGLAINRFRGAGVYLSAGDGNVIQGNFIGTNVTGTLALRNFGSGVEVDGSLDNLIGGVQAADGNLLSGNSQGITIKGTAANGNIIQGNRIGTNASGIAELHNDIGIYIYNAPGNYIGGTEEGAGNLISGNGTIGIYIYGAGAIENTVQGNRIGTNADGTAALRNIMNGIAIFSGPNNLIGGTEEGAGNLISGNGYQGIVISASGNIVQGNRIGTNGDGTAALGNFEGISINGTGNIIGSAEVGAGNLISGNTGGGVSIAGAASTGNIVRGNSINGNGGLGIDLYPRGVTPNDTGDADMGPNALQNYPVLISAASDGSTTTTVQGTLNSAANKVFTLDFYASPTCDASGYGEGETYLGAGQATTNASGNASFSITLPAAAPAGWVVTATATDPMGNTSEFSACVTVMPEPLVMVMPAPAPGETTAAMSISELWYGRRRTRGF